MDETDHGDREPDPELQADYWTHESAEPDSTGREKNKSCAGSGEQGRTPKYTPCSWIYKP